MTATTRNDTLAILAGGGAMPAKVAAAAKAAGRPVFVIGISGEAATGDGFPDEMVGWGQFGRIEDLLKARGATDLVLIGSIGRRPDFSEVKLDWLALRSLPRIVAGMVGGDDSVLSTAVKFIESRGFRVLGAHEVVPGLVAGPGSLTRVRPGAKQTADIRAAIKAAIAIGVLDAGQAAVAVNEQVIALEGLEGTDAMLERVGALRGSGRARWRGRAGVLAKWSKPQQDLRVDMPAIGPRTVVLAAAAGLAGIAIEAGRVMVVDRDEMIAEADAAGLFVTAEASAGTSAAIPA